MDENSGGVVFNQAYQQQLRIHELVNEINFCSTNPLAKNIQAGGLMNYKVVFNDLQSLFVEMNLGAKWRDKDDQTLNKFLAVVGRIIDLYPIEMMKKFNNHGLIERKMTMVPENWKHIEAPLFRLRVEMFKMLDKYGWGNPVKDDDEDEY